MPLADQAALSPTTWLIPERIPADSLTLLYGPSESGKSFIALHWALTIALRHPDRAVIYVAPEGGRVRLCCNSVANVGGRVWYTLGKNKEQARA